MIVVAGDHDCLGNDVSADLMGGPRVQTTTRPASMSCASTRPRRTTFLDQSSRQSRRRRLDAIDAALDAAPAGVLVVITLHHHVSRCQSSTWRTPVVMAGFFLHLGALAGARPAPAGPRSLRSRVHGTPTCRAARACLGRPSDARLQRRLVDRAGARAGLLAPGGDSSSALRSGSTFQPPGRTRPRPSAPTTASRASQSNLPTWEPWEGSQPSREEVEPAEVIPCQLLVDDLIVC